MNDDSKQESLLGNIINYYNMNNYDIDVESLLDEFLTFFIAGKNNLRNSVNIKGEK